MCNWPRYIRFGPTQKQFQFACRPVRVLTERARTVSIGLTAHVRSAVTAAAAFPLLNKLQPSNPSLISPPPGPVREKETWIYSWSGTSPKSYHTILLIPSASLVRALSTSYWEEGAFPNRCFFKINLKKSLSLSPHMWNPVTPVLGSQKSERGLRSPLKPSNTPLERHIMTTAAEFLFWWCQKREEERGRERESEREIRER
eukprot:sb/3470683/